jgi:hypothetical protein
VKLEFWQTLYIVLQGAKKRPLKMTAGSSLKITIVYDSFGCRLLANSRSNAALVSSLFRCLMSDTQSVTVETISRAVALDEGAFRTFAFAAAASERFTIFIFVLSIITFIPLVKPDNWHYANFIIGVLRFANSTITYIAPELFHKFLYF